VIRLSILGSGSGGNAFILECSGGMLLLDAGFSARELNRRAGLLGIDLGRLTAVVLTHEHGDHSSGARRLATTHGVPIAATDGTLRALALPADCPQVVLRGSSVTEIGPFSVETCRTLHDAAEPMAMVIEAGDARVGLAYDFGRPTMGLRHLLRHCDAIVLESNYDDVLLRTSDYPPSVQHRIAGSGGHLSNRVAAELLGELHHDGLSLVVLAHLSRRCNEPEVAREAAAAALAIRGFRGAIEVADQHTPHGPLSVRASGAKYRVMPQVEFELS